MEVEDFVFVKFRSKITYCFWEVSAWLSKLDGANLEGFLGKRSFFGWLIVFKTSSRHSADVFWTLKADCQNCVFICPDKLLLEKIYFRKNVQFDVFFSESGGKGGGGGGGWSFSEFCGKIGLLAKIVRGVIRTGLNVSRATFWGKTRFSEKFPVNNFFQTFSIVLVFCRLLAYLSEMCPSVQMKLLRETFKQINVYESFSELEQIFVVLWQQHFNRLSKMRFICLEEIFHGNFVTWKVLSNWITFFGNRGLCFLKIKEQNYVLFLKSFRMIVKTRWCKFGFFLGKRSFFLVESIFSSLFLDIRQMFFEVWKQIVKIVSLSVQINFSWKKYFSGTMFSMMFFFQKGGQGGVEFFRSLWKNWTFGGKLSGELSERDSTFPELLFEVRHVFPKNFL